MKKKKPLSSRMKRRAKKKQQKLKELKSKGNWVVVPESAFVGVGIMRNDVYDLNPTDAACVAQRLSQQS